MELIQRLLKEGSVKQILLHCCCAVCSCSIIERLLDDGVILFFYNPNIHPENEYLRRKNELIQYAGKLNVPCIDAEYEDSLWFDRMRGLEAEPERGARCTECLRMRLYKAAECAALRRIRTIATTLGISRWKDLQQVNEAGRWAVSHFEAVQFLNSNWRKNGGIQRMAEISREEEFYRQTYCGCLFSNKNK